MAVHAHINTVPGGSTGGIMMGQHKALLAKGEDSYAFWGRGRAAEGEHEMRFATDFEVRIDALMTRLDDRAGFHSKAATLRLLCRLDEIKPDVIHLHNLHGYYLNVEMLFAWLVEHNCRVEWTLHDCWAFTGHCAYFTYAKCDGWKTGCGDCPQRRSYPASILVDNSAKNFEDKRRVFTSISLDRMTLVSPSQWLKGLVEKSFLRDYSVQVRRNDIDRAVFKPTPSDFRERCGVGDRFMILGVASPWTERKGLSDFVQLSIELNPEKYAVVLIGLSAKQIKEIPSSIIGLERTESKHELAEIYSAADLLFNPTLEDNYPTVNLEAEACGTPVVTYDTGGCPETVALLESRVVGSLREATQLMQCKV